MEDERFNVKLEEPGFNGETFHLQLTEGQINLLKFLRENGIDMFNTTIEVVSASQYIRI